jgi:outer membrane protein assembly factor BamD
MQNARRFAGIFGCLLAGALLLTGCEKKNVAAKSPAPGADTSAEPDKVLYERAMNDMAHGKQSVARFELQTLLNTYPDSEYVAKAKLAIADSFYKDGDSAGLAQAISEYKDFGTFFPYLDEAAYAQYQVGMAHMRQMEKPDRDESQAQMAEQEFQNYLLKYPQGANVAQAEQHLREVQEVLAEGNFRVARFYYNKGSYHASGARLKEIVDRYPLYSHADEALWMLGQSFERYEKLKEFAVPYYQTLVRLYPLSPYMAEAKKRLEKLGVPVPQPDPVALARMQKEKEIQHHERPGIFQKSLGLVKSGPTTSAAAHSGPPQLNAPGQEPGTETLSGGGRMSIAASGAGTSAGSSEAVRTVKAGPADSPAPGSDAAANGDPGADAATGADAAEAAKPPDPTAYLPNHDDTSVKKKPASPEESSSKKKKGLRRLIPF